MCNCKRSFDKFAAPLSPFQYEHLEGLNESEPEDEPEIKEPGDFTVGELIAAGSDMAQVTAKIYDLTNEIHPIFRDENICACKYQDEMYCLAPHFANHPERLADKEKASPVASPYPKDNIVVRAILQLVTMFMTHEDTLPFWAGIVDCGRGPVEHPARIHVRPRKKLSQARKAETLELLTKYADEVRIHFKVLGDDSNPGGSLSDGYASWEHVRKEDPDYDLSKDHTVECPCRATMGCVCGPGAVYAHRNGKPVIEESMFNHIYMNVSNIAGFDQSSDEWRSMTIKQVKAAIFSRASTVCHEFAHAFMRHHLRRGEEAFVNDENLAEAGYAWENFTFGGAIDIRNNQGSGYYTFTLIPWPDLTYYNHYTSMGASMGIRCFGRLNFSRRFGLERWRTEQFLDQSFWDAEMPEEDFKKMWIRPYLEKPDYREEHTLYSSGHEAPVEVVAKKQRLSDLAMKSQRAYAQQARRNERVARPDRWRRWQKKLQERKVEFYDREKDRLDALWQRCVPAFDKMSLQ